MKPPDGTPGRGLSDHGPSTALCAKAEPQPVVRWKWYLEARVPAGPKSLSLLPELGPETPFSSTTLVPGLLPELASVQPAQGRGSILSLVCRCTGPVDEHKPTFMRGCPIAEVAGRQWPIDWLPGCWKGKAWKVRDQCLDQGSVNGHRGVAASERTLNHMLTTSRSMCPRRSPEQASR